MNAYLILILAILIGDYLLNVIVDALNMRHVRTDLPKAFEGYHDRKTYRRSRQYLRETGRFGIVSDSITTFLTIAFILAGGFNGLDHLARSLHLGSILTGLVFAGLIMLMAQGLPLPFSLYRTFVIEEKYGFNKTTPKTFVLDVLKTCALAAVVGGPLFAGVLWFFEELGQLAWAICWLALTMFQIGIMWLAPVLIMPIFNRFTPLPESPLRAAIEDYAREQDFKLKGIFTMDGSRRSTKANAFFTGLGKFKRIVLLDTLIEKHTVDELVSILAHEMGHHKKRHLLKTTALSILTTGLMLYVLSVFIENPQLFEAFRMDHLSVYASLFFFGFLYTPIHTIVSLYGNFLSRKYEYEADAFSVETFRKPNAMISALKRLSVDHLTHLTPHPWKVFLSDTHPPILKRIQAIRRSVRQSSIDNRIKAGY